MQEALTLVGVAIMAHQMALTVTILFFLLLHQPAVAVAAQAMICQVGQAVLAVVVLGDSLLLVAQHLLQDKVLPVEVQMEVPLIGVAVVAAPVRQEPQEEMEAVRAAPEQRRRLQALL